MTRMQSLYKRALVRSGMKLPPQKAPSNTLKAHTGFVLLLSVLILSAVGLATTLSVLLLGLGSSRTSFAVEQSDQARGLAEACAEEALQRIDDSTPFTGSDVLSMGQGSCTFTVTNEGGQNRSIDSEGQVDNSVWRLDIKIDKINPDINITSWQEVVSF